MIRQLWLPPLGMLITVAMTAWLFAQAPEASDPFGSSVEAPKVVPADTEKKKKAAPEKIEADPIVLGIRDSAPKTPTDLVQAAINLVNYGRPDEAKRYAKSLIESSLDGATSWQLQRRFGTAPFLRFSSQADLQPEGRQLAEIVLSGSQKHVRDPARLDGLIRQLGDARREVRSAAFADLREADEDAAVAIILVLADRSRNSEHAVLRSALNRLGAVSIGPLLGSLDTPDDRLRSQVISVLAGLRTTEAVPFLLRPSLLSEPGSPQQQVAATALTQLLGKPPSRTDAERMLYRQLVAYSEGRLPGKLNLENRIEVWRWDETRQRPDRVQLDITTAPLLFAARLGEELTALNPDRREYRRLHLVAVLESAKSTAGWEVPLETGSGAAWEEAASQSAVLEDVLGFALDRGRIGAAVAALELLGATGDAGLLQSNGGQPSGMARALRHSNRRVRFAALQAILRLAPQSPFPGASYVPEAIAYFSQTTGSRRVVIAHPRAEQSQSLAGFLHELGVEADLTFTGNQAFQDARRNPDYEFVLLSDALDRPPVEELIQQFRRDPLTAGLPIGVLTRAESTDRLRRALDGDRLTEVFNHPTETAGASFLMRRMLERTARDAVPFEERLRQADSALGYWTALAERPEAFGFFDFSPQQFAAEAALGVPSLTAKAAHVLGLHGSSEAQRSLISLANQSKRRLADRQAAAAAFDLAVQRRGILLTQSEIVDQYALYNQLASADADSQRILGAVLDAIERPYTASEAANTNRP